MNTLFFHLYSHLRYSQQNLQSLHHSLFEEGLFVKEVSFDADGKKFIIAAASCSSHLYNRKKKLSTWSVMHLV